MVEQRAGNKIDLLTASIRTTGGALISTTLYTLSGVVYAFITSPAATGQYFFVILTIALLLRPIKGVTQTLHKIGSEPGESVNAYLGVALLFGGMYLLGIVLLAVSASSYLATWTIYDQTLVSISLVYAVSTAIVMTVEALVSAVGYPSVVTWVGGLKGSIVLAVLLLFNQSITTVTELMIVTVTVRLVVYGTVGVLLGLVPSLPTYHEVSRAWSFAKWSIPDQVLDRVSYNMPVYVLGIVSTPLAVGIYEAADRFGDFGATIAWQLSAPLLSKVSGDDAAGVDIAAYIDAAVTGGSGITFAVFGYLLSTREIIAEIAFSTAPEQFSATVLIVGGINIFRGFWTLSSHVLEGIGHPDMSFRTKLYGLVGSLPLTALLGSQFGAVAGAVGYAVMNIIIGCYVLYYNYQLLGSLLVERTITSQLVFALAVEAVVMYLTVRLMLQLSVAPILTAIAAVPIACLSFAIPLAGVSSQAQAVFRRTYELTTDPVR